MGPPAMLAQTIKSKKLPKTDWPTSHAVKAGDWIFTSAMHPMDSEGTIVGATIGRVDVGAQTAQCLANLDLVLGEFGISRANVAKIRTYLSDVRAKKEVDAVLASNWKKPLPATATIGKYLPFSDIALQVEATAHAKSPASEVVPARRAGPEGIHAAGGTTAGNFFFSNGHPSLDANGKLVARGDIRGQVEQSLDNLGEALRAAGMDYSDVIKMNCTAAAWWGFSRYNEIYAKFFKEPFPARATIQGRLCNEAALVEYEAVAAKGKEKVTIESVVTGSSHFSNKKRADTIYVPGLPAAMAPHSHAVRVDEVIYLCGQIPYEESGLMVGWSDIRAQTIKTMENHVVTMAAIGSTVDDFVKTNVTVTEESMIPIFIEEYAKFFKAPFPAMTIAIGGLAQDCMVLEIEAVAIVGASKNKVCVVS